MTSSKQRGAKIESLASQHLQAAGLTELSRNFRSRFGEIDLIMAEGNTLVFVEVRHRARAKFGSALESITPVKVRRIQATAQMYLASANVSDNTYCRFDVVTLDGAYRMNGHGYDNQNDSLDDTIHSGELRWIKNAF